MPSWNADWETARYGLVWITLFWAGVIYAGRRLYRRFAKRN
jgi:hypothetical protein